MNGSPHCRECFIIAPSGVAHWEPGSGIRNEVLCPWDMLHHVPSELRAFCTEVP